MIELRECQVCHGDMIPCTGPIKTDCLVVWDDLTEESYKDGKISSQFGWTVLRHELSRWGVDLYQLRVAPMWYHPPTKIKGDYDYHIQQTILEAMGKKFVLLLGSEATKFFLNLNSIACSGLVLQSDLLGAKYVIGTQNPNDVLSKSAGEFQLGIEKFAKFYKQERTK